MATQTKNLHKGDSDSAEHAPSSQTVASSSQGPASSGGQSEKPRKPPSVTPNTFRRFFTPRQSAPTLSSARKAFQDITFPANNRTQRRPRRDGDALEPFPDISTRTDENGQAIATALWKKRKILHFQEPACERERVSCANLSSPLTGPEKNCPRDSESPSLGSMADANIALHEDELVQPRPVKQYRHWQRPNMSSRLLQRELGLAGYGRQPIRVGCPYYETINFWSGPSDQYQCHDTTGEDVIPFSTASCNTNSLVAVGDESGGVRMLESGQNRRHDFQRSFLAFQPHANAILDMNFSSDDLLLATASGDQTGLIIDMPTQRPKHAFHGHTMSVKEIRFQPGQSSNNVVATSSRDGNILIWDLRCSGTNAPSPTPVATVGDMGMDTSIDTTPHIINRARPVNAIYDAHVGTLPRAVSVTSLAFLPAGREHLLLSASEVRGTIHLWDLRASYTSERRRGRERGGPGRGSKPLSTVPAPPARQDHAFGITSLDLSHDGARLYSLNRDNAIYVYATSHLILGHAPELSSPAPAPHKNSSAPPKQGLGPIYALRHPSFNSLSFYVKLQLRKPQTGGTELLAVGSSLGSPVIFPTDERYLDARHYRIPASSTMSESSTAAPSDNRTPIPYYQHHGTALVRGHTQEVTCVSWTAEGNLVTAGDDCTVRCWREDDKEARQLRLAGEGQGRRWNCGWAEYDGDEASDPED